MKMQHEESSSRTEQINIYVYIYIDKLYWLLSTDNGLNTNSRIYILHNHWLVA